MTPDFRILADSADVTGIIRDRFVSLTLTDEAGVTSDTVEIRLDDRAPHIALPEKGAKLDVYIGYRETGIARMGLFVVDETDPEGPPDELVIKARAADMRDAMKSTKTRSFDSITLGELVKTIAEDNGYAAHVGADLAGIELTHIDQVNESDIHFLTRISRTYGAVAKPAGGMLLFVPAGEAKSATGKLMPAVALTRKDLERWSVTIADRGKYRSVVAKWHDIAAAKEMSVTLGDGDPSYTIRRRYPDEATAKKAAEARLAAFARGAGTIRFSCGGDNRLASEGTANISGVREGVDGAWHLTKVTHIIDDMGYRCDCDGETPKAAS